MTNPITDIAQWLSDNGYGTIGTDLFLSTMPPSPDNCTAIIDTGGNAPMTYLPIEQPTFQILVRNVDFETGKVILNAIQRGLHGLTNENLAGTANGSHYYYIFAQQNNQHIGRDEVGREVFSVNFYCKNR